MALTVKQIIGIIGFLMTMTAGAVLAYADIKSQLNKAMDEVREAELDRASIRMEVKSIKCLIEQQNRYMIYKMKPTHEC